MCSSRLVLLVPLFARVFLVTLVEALPERDCCCFFLDSSRIQASALHFTSLFALLVAFWDLAMSVFFLRIPSRLLGGVYDPPCLAFALFPTNAVSSFVVGSKANRTVGTRLRDE
jgi:hypothetical protein